MSFPEQLRFLLRKRQKPGIDIRRFFAVDFTRHCGPHFRARTASDALPAPPAKDLNERSSRLSATGISAETTTFAGRPAKGRNWTIDITPIQRTSKGLTSNRWCSIYSGNCVSSKGLWAARFPPTLLPSRLRFIWKCAKRLPDPFRSFGSPHV